MSAVSTGPRITPFLWFDENAGEAVEHYLSIFPNSRPLTEFHDPRNPDGRPLVISFELDGQRFTALNGGAVYKFNPAVSFVVSCETQKEIDHYWDRLSEGGLEVQCGWLTDKFGLSWQIVPAKLSELIRHPKAMHAMMAMKKLVIAELEAAAQA
jgi:predicted 3-demethylubiquinone-9 3-methyltransferase (glyoxalase superfamily)